MNGAFWGNWRPFEAGGARNGSLTFLKGDSSCLTTDLSKLDDDARRIASALERAGATGERALLLYPQGLDYIAAFFGCLYAGVVAVPLHMPRRGGSNARLRSVADDSAARFVLSSRATLDDALSACHRQGASPLTGVATDVLDGDAAWTAPQIDELGPRVPAIHIRFDRCAKGRDGDARIPRCHARGHGPRLSAQCRQRDRQLVAAIS